MKTHNFGITRGEGVSMSTMVLFVCVLHNLRLSPCLRLKKYQPWCVGKISEVIGFFSNFQVFNSVEGIVRELYQIIYGKCFRTPDRQSDAITTVLPVSG